MKPDPTNPKSLITHLESLVTQSTKISELTKALKKFERFWSDYETYIRHHLERNFVEKGRFLNTLERCLLVEGVLCEADPQFAAGLSKSCKKGSELLLTVAV